MVNNKKEAEQAQALVILPKVELDAITASLNEIKELIKGKAKEEVEAQWIESEEARKMLGVSSKTWQTYRDSRVIPFSQFGRKIYVRKGDIEAFLQSNLIKN